MTVSTVTRFRAKVGPWEGDTVYYELHTNINHINIKELVFEFIFLQTLNLYQNTVILEIIL
jgi:hypothetical protein